MTTITIHFTDKERQPESKTCSFVKVFGSFLLLVMPEDSEGFKTIYTYPAHEIAFTISKSKMNVNNDRRSRDAVSEDL